MDAKEMASRLNCREYMNEMTDDEVALAKENNLVVVFGRSDDNMVFVGAIDDAVGCYDGGSAHISYEGVAHNKCDCHDCPYHKGELEKLEKITAVWDTEGYSWVYETNIPHESFDILEDGEKYCRGIVLNLYRNANPPRTEYNIDAKNPFPLPTELSFGVIEKANE